MVVSRSAGLGQTTYYVAATGSDHNNGQSVSTPVQSLSKVSSFILQPGDTVLFRRGDTFRGSLRIRQSGSAGRPIVVDAYGLGSKPTLAGSVPVTGWLAVGNHIWQASCPACGSDVTGLYRDGTALPLGRYPNADAPRKGYLSIQSHVGGTQLTSQQPLPTNWTGGQAVIRATQWILDRATITRQQSGTLTLNNTSSYVPNDGWGFFIQNHPATLDQTGEWYYNPADQTIRLYDPGNPNGRPITATVTAHALDLANVSFMTVRNLRITQALTTGVLATNASSLTLTGNDITESGEDGVVITGSGTDVVLENNRIIGANNNGLLINAYRNVTLRGNTVRRVGLVPGRGRSGDGQYNGLQCYSTANALIEDNRIDSVGFNGLIFATDVLIQHNVISNYCLTKSDGGGIYAWNGQKQLVNRVRIQSNIVYNGIGAPEGSFQDGYSGVNGIFLDDCLENVELTQNTVFDNRGWGIYLRGDSHINLTGNTCFNNGDAQFVMYHNGGYCPFRNNIVKQNVFVSKLPSQMVARYESNADDLNQYGLFDYNYYSRPFADVFKIRAMHSWSLGGEVTLADWQHQFEQDPNAKNSPLTYPQHVVNQVSPTARINATFTSSIQGWTVWSPYNNGQAVRDNTLDGGSLRVSFPTPAKGKNSYVLVFSNMGAVTKGRSYLLRFDAVASASQKLQVFLRQRDAPYADLGQRADVLVGPTRASYEVAFTAPATEANAVLVYSMDEAGQTIWLDNIRLQEATITSVNPDDKLRIVYNPTGSDSLVALDGTYRDVKNHYYGKSVALPPFTSVVLLKDSLPPVDLHLSLKTGQRTLKIGEATSFSLTLHNAFPVKADLAERVQWTCRLPPNLQIVGAAGIPYNDSMLTGTVRHLTVDTTFVFWAKPTMAGTYRLAAQVSATTFADTDSTPDSGTADDEDDAATVTFRAGDPNSSNVFTSPNPGQSVTPTLTNRVYSAQTVSADLSLRMELSNRVPARNDLIRCTLWVSNAGPVTVGTVQVRNLLPAGLQFVGGAGWSADERLLNTSLSNLKAGTTVSVSFQARVVEPGRWENQAQIYASDQPDPDSVPDNGFSNGEDDQARADFRVR